MDQSSTPLSADQEVFARVWQRVMPEGGPLVLASGAAQTAEDGPPERLPLGAGCTDAVPFLRARIECELKHGKSCRFLHNCWGGSGRLLDLVARCERRARRLATALLLIAGGWYLPAAHVQPQRWPDVRGGLRDLFHAFQREEALYRAAAEDSGDPLLRELLEELAAESLQMRDMVRMELETR